MKNTLAFFLPPLLIATIIFFAFQFFVLRPTEKGALQVTASPESEVYLNDKYIGKTPLCKCPLPNKSGKESSRDLLQAGSYTIKLVPVNKEFSPYSDSIVIRKSLLTVIDRKFALGAKSEGSIITLDPIPDKKTTKLLQPEKHCLITLKDFWMSMLQFSRLRLLFPMHFLLFSKTLVMRQ